MAHMAPRACPPSPVRLRRRRVGAAALRMRSRIGPREDFPGLPVLDEEAEAEGDAENTEEGGETEDETEEGSAEEVPEPTSDEPYVQYLEDGGRLAITIWGSSTCPIVPTDLRVTAEAGEGMRSRPSCPSPRTPVHDGLRAAHDRLLDAGRRDHDRAARSHGRRRRS